ALYQESQRKGGLAQPFGRAILPFLRHFPPPLDAINVQAIQSMTLWGVVAGYSSARFDQVAMGGFLMGQLVHHYSALSSAVTMTVLALERPATLELMLESLFRGWTHGRETPLLMGTDWEPLWDLRIDQ